MLGSIQYQINSSLDGLEVGRDLPQARVRAFDGRCMPIQDLVHPGMIIIFLSADCLPCLSKDYIREIERLVESKRLGSDQFIVVASQSTPPRWFEEQVRSAGIRRNVWRAEQTLRGWEDPYNTTRSRKPTMPVVLRLGYDRKIDSLREIDDWLRSVKPSERTVSNATQSR
jgi:hypothetical protein